jgi:hypothetical protein
MQNKEIVYFCSNPEFMNILGTEIALVDRKEFTDMIIKRNKDNSFETLDKIYIPMYDNEFYIEGVQCQ